LDEKEIDPKIAAEIEDIRIKNGSLTINEARGLSGRDAYDGVGDIPGFLTATGFQPLPSEEDINARAEAALAAAEALATPDDDKPEKRVKKKYSDPLKRPAAIAAHTAIHNTLTAVFDRASHHVASQLRGMAILGKADDDEEKRAEAIADDLNLFDLIEVKTISGALDSLATDAAESALADLGLFGQVGSRSTSWAERHAADLVTKITDATREMLRKTIAQGLQETDIPGIAERIAKEYAFSAERALLIADTETAFANGQGALQGYKEAEALGIKIKKQWLDHPGACPVCAENARAGAIDLDDPFPGGVTTTPQHPACRCSTISVIDD
ncbi:MAG: phage minor head protein, partial [Blastocatellales bacterium]